MTVKEFPSHMIQIQISFWDFVIRFMTTLQGMRNRFYMFKGQFGYKFSPNRTIWFVIISLVLGVYLGILLGFFGI
jgi:hypothetical protein